MIVGHNPFLVILSASISILGSFTALVLLVNFETYRRSEAKFRMFMVAITLGAVIFATNFVGVLALNADLNLVHNWDLLSAAAASSFIGSCLGFYFLGAQHPAPTQRLVVAVVFLGLGMAATQYLALAAIAGTDMQLSWFLTGIYVAVSMQIAATAYWILFKRRGVGATILGSLLLGMAICANHYITVAAAPSLDVALALAPRSASAISENHLAWAAAIVVYLICSIFLSISVIMQFQDDMR
jgi:NO-binding membrane sensor protein with MHYT domain